MSVRKQAIVVAVVALLIILALSYAFDFADRVERLLK